MCWARDFFFYFYKYCRWSEPYIKILVPICTNRFLKTFKTYRRSNLCVSLVHNGAVNFERKPSNNFEAYINIYSIVFDIPLCYCGDNWIHSIYYINKIVGQKTLFMFFFVCSLYIGWSTNPSKSDKEYKWNFFHFLIA